MSNGATRAVIAFLFGVAGTVAVIIAGGYLGIIDLVDTSEPPLPLFIVILVCLTVAFVLSRTGGPEKE